MRFLNIDSFIPQAIDDHKIVCEHVRVLVIFGRDVLGEGIGQGQSVGATKWNLEDVSGMKISRRTSKVRTHDVRCHCRWECPEEEVCLDMLTKVLCC